MAFQEIRRGDNGVFPKWNENSVNSVLSRNVIILDQFGWERSNLNAWIQPILSHTRRHINFL